MIDKSDIENRAKKKIDAPLFLDLEVHRVLTRMASKNNLSIPNQINHCLIDTLLNRKKL